MKTLAERFTDFADWVSEAMGTPANIGFWFFMVFMWFAIFWINPSLQNSNFLPSWFTSNAFNFPLNSITTLCELFIGFLCAAATNRAQRILMEVLGKLTVAINHMVELADHIQDLDEQMEKQNEEIITLQRQIHKLVKEVHEVVRAPKVRKLKVKRTR